MERLLKPSEVAEQLGCGVDKARLLMGRMKHLDLSAGNGIRRDLRVWERDLVSWITENMSDPMPERKKGRKPTKKPALIPYRKV